MSATEDGSDTFDERLLRPRPAVRPARHEDIPACADVWREAIGHYLGRLNQLPPGGDLVSLRRLMDHLLSTDRSRFWVAERADEERIVGFGSATVRGPVWFLALLFVVPEEQGLGLGQTILERTLREATGAVRTGGIRATVTDSAQPISHALYGRIGIVPRMPILHLLGSPDETGRLPALPHGVAARAVNDAGPFADDAIASLDREVLGYVRPDDHRFFWRDGRRGFLYEDGAGSAVAYGYVAPSGRVGPIAVRDERLLGPIIGHLVEAVPPADASGIWVPGAAGSTVSTLLEARYRIDGFPALLGWDRPFGSFDRYVPASLALL